MGRPSLEATMLLPGRRRLAPPDVLGAPALSSRRVSVGRGLTFRGRRCRRCCCRRHGRLGGCATAHWWSGRGEARLGWCVHYLLPRSIHYLLQSKCVGKLNLRITWYPTTDMSAAARASALAAEPSKRALRFQSTSWRTSMALPPSAQPVMTRSVHIQRSQGTKPDQTRPGNALAPPPPRRARGKGAPTR